MVRRYCCHCAIPPKQIVRFALLDCLLPPFMMKLSKDGVKGKALCMHSSAKQAPRDRVVAFQISGNLAEGSEDRELAVRTL